METLRQLIQRKLRMVDRIYRAYHRLQPVGEVLVVGRSRYRSSPKQFADGTRLLAGDSMGTLHFNNARFAQFDAATSRRAARQFSRLLLDSMRRLAERARHDPEFSDLRVYHAVSWLPPHGQRLGFVTQPFPDGLRKHMLAVYFRLLLWAFAPAPETRASAVPRPTIYWLTRAALLRQFPETSDR